MKLLGVDSNQFAEFTDMARVLHYPGCWDTLAYPTLLHAVWESIDTGKFECQTCKDVDAFIKSSHPAVESSKGQKHDDGKQKWHALPLEILEPLADVMEAGAKKYEKFNCLEPFDNWDERFYNGAMRHLEASQIDPLAINEEDGGVYHLAQVAVNALLRLHNARRENDAKGNI